MGNCRSCYTEAVAAPSANASHLPSATVKLILQDGMLQEFNRLMLVSDVLLKEPGSFVCDADAMDFDCLVSALDCTSILQMGQLYFLLPLSMLGRPLQTDELGALAVRASGALVKCCCRNGFVVPLVFTDPETILEGGSPRMVVGRGYGGTVQGGKQQQCA